MPSQNYAASTKSSFSSSTGSSSSPLKGTQKCPQHVSGKQAVRAWAKELAADLGRSPSYRYDLEHNNKLSPMAAQEDLIGGPFNNSRQTRT
ncbi:hypothetical protein CMQ_7789 [Grosmannia clavigera kw1407]|uniref:Uncharacterized protein n=1 Tax=Grosmannia clavigera (strain kw1407 / UAMH 11150) TaxID=655863 RepID=F0XRN5_GROCL|nr:uncharacterized protein CMQ_7789 [Grosmannia clavigera kw1407]EFW99421.1 hypothetical protein CMQ_7789 [Grosmannia clavigera kw1407]